MKIALSVWNGRIAPVFDVSKRCVIVSSPHTEENAPCVPFPEGDCSKRADFLLTQGVSILICGAISQDCEEEILSRGIDIVPYIAGPLDAVIEAWSNGTLTRTDFSMPGCGCPRRRCRRGAHAGNMHAAHGRKGEHI